MELAEGMDIVKCSNGSAGASPGVGGSAGSASFPVVALLESAVPSLSLMPRILTDYLNIDISQYFGLIIVLVGIVSTVRYCVTQLQSTWRGYYKSTSEVGSDDLLNADLFHHDKMESEIDAMAEEFAQKLPADVFTPAEVQGHLLRYKKDPQAVLDNAQELIDPKEAEKERKSS
jgi:hypothetical protein